MNNNDSISRVRVKKVNNYLNILSINIFEVKYTIFDILKFNLRY